MNQHSDFDPLKPETFDSAHADYALLRAKCPVAHTNAYGGFWALSKHEDVVRTLHEPHVFVTSVQNVVPRVAFTGRRPPLHLDPPEHTPYRAILNPLLTQERVSALEPDIRKFTKSFLQDFINAAGGDVCESYAGLVPVKVFGHWMQLPENLEQQLGQAGPAFVKAVQSAEYESMKITSMALYDMARSLIKLRRQTPLDPSTDPTSAMLAARINDMPIPEEMVVGMVRQVLVVGIVAPMVMIGSIVVHLSRDTKLQNDLRLHPERIPAAIEEFLRLYTPYRGFARTAIEPVSFKGRKILPGEPIALLYASANRDEEVFKNSDQFHLNRENIKEHLAFGRGAHYCAGASLARLELQIMLEELLAGTKSFEVNGKIAMTPFPEIGPWRVPIKLTAHKKFGHHESSS
jgi:cytochrome P450